LGSTQKRFETKKLKIVPLMMQVVAFNPCFLQKVSTFITNKFLIKTNLMKKSTALLLPIFLLTITLQAQDGKTAFANAKKAFGIYNLAPSSSRAKLVEAQQNIDLATTDSEQSKEARVWKLKGDIYNEIATQMVAARQLGLNENEIPSVQDPALEANAAYAKALELAEKLYETKDALRGLRATQFNLYNLGIFAYEDGNYQQAYTDFMEIIAVHKLLKNNETESSLDNREDYLQQLYITGLAALNANLPSDAASLFEELYNQNYDKPAIYEALYKIKVEEDIDAAYQYLQTGRNKFPDDVSLLFAEINHFLRLNKLDELISKLEAAISKEPENVSLYSTLGNVYDNLFQKEVEAGNQERAQRHFDNAMNYYQEAINRQPNFFDAIYSMGALHFNAAAVKTKELQALEDDFSAEGLKKYDVKKAEVFAEFDKALPYFKKAESLNPNDINTLIALKEIFARKDDLQLSNEFKNRLDRVQAGGTNNTSFFRE
jgi:tetratricopeptide (TPR) repeat protein